MIAFGLLDSGFTDTEGRRAVAARRFVLDCNAEIEEGPAEPDELGHGTALAGVVLTRVPSVRLLVAQVFDRRGVAAPAAAAAGLDWLVGQGARVVNMSFGLTQDRAVLAQACARAVKAGVLLVASVPARGPAVYPASYAGVIRATGDARCGDREISHLAEPRADFGALPWLPDGAAHGQRASVAGASVAAARVAAELAAFLAEAPEGGAPDAVARLIADALPLGPQRDHLIGHGSRRQ